MRLPDRQSIRDALLEVLGDGRVRHDDDIVAALVKRFDLSTADLQERTNTGRSKFENEFDFAKGDLGEGKRGQKLIRRVGSKKYVISPAGLAKLGLSQQPSSLSVIPSEAVIFKAEDSPLDSSEEFEEETELQRALRGNIQQLRR